MYFLDEDETKKVKDYFLNIRVLPRALTKMGHTCTSIKKERFFF